MDEDFYIEETSPIKVIIVIILFLGFIFGGVYYYIHYVKENKVKLSTVTVELGDKLPTDIKTYITCSNPDNYKLDISNISVDENGNVNSTGEYSYKIIRDSQILKGKLYVKDTVAPNVEVEELTVGVNESFLPSDFIVKCDDLSLPCSAKYQNIEDEKLNENEGNYKFNIIIYDDEGNSLVKEVSLIVNGTNTLYEKKSSDLNFDHLSAEDDNWDKSYTVKLEKAVLEESIKYKEIFEDISLREYSFDKKEKNKEIIVVYNKYNFVIGLSIKVTFEDDTFIYVTDNNAIIKSEED